jgi:hypothetical protein
MWIGMLIVFVVHAMVGCYGSTVLSGSVSRWHAGLETEDKYVKEAVFLPLFFFVLPFTSFIDYFILNAVEFWSGDNPLKSSSASTRTIENERYRLVFSRTDAPEGPRLAVRVVDRTDGRPVEEFSLETRPDGTVMKSDREGRWVASAKRQPDGGLLVNARETGKRMYSPQEFNRLLLAR